jgi:hypothetical protein
MEFGAQQCILVRNDAARNKLRAEVGDIGLIMSACSLSLRPYINMLALGPCMRVKDSSSTTYVHNSFQESHPLMTFVGVAIQLL